MKRLLLPIGCVVLLSGCGGSSGEGSAQDEANVAFKRPMLLSTVLNLVHPTEGMEGSMLSGFQKANLQEVRQRARTGPLHIQRMLASGSADDLRSLSHEPGVRTVRLKSEILERVRRAREGR